MSLTPQQVIAAIDALGAAVYPKSLVSTAAGTVGIARSGAVKELIQAGACANCLGDTFEGTITQTGDIAVKRDRASAVGMEPVRGGGRRQTAIPAHWNCNTFKINGAKAYVNDIW